jgi:hypothetical protein
VPAATSLALRGTIGALPSGQAWTGIARSVFDPGAMLRLTASSSELLLIESGRFTLRADGPVAVRRAGSAAMAPPAAAGTAITLAAGDGAVVLPANVAIELRNPGPGPATAINADFGAVDSYQPGPGFISDILAERYDPPVQPGATIELRRVTLPPDATLPPPNPGAVRLVTSAKLGQYLRRAADGSYANRNPQPLDAYVLEIASAAAGTPAATPPPATTLQSGLDGSARS